ncbi:GGDEF: diguanylate cyclase (GGDEF) domain [Gaiella occulta]|uniref:GGDEF: diguanylate cyclase (GGDEF) domain n=1 Tax=Gaiella occulta TaxID=1002870 RepID=A0A7M2Z0Y7_9ACTN|nr:diguanylate cyclase [Gaiella occulta]RDI75685.1 GGDEF: diguanylate cyclase (GGDEF) domain [Gaiella occulta]
MSPPANTPAATAVPRPGDDDGTRAASPALVESYRLLADVFHEVLSEQSLDALLERIADTVGELIPHDDLAFYEADEAARELRAVFARGQYADEVLADDPFPFGRGITGWAVEHGRPVLANRADLDPRVRFVEGTPPDPESLIAVPLVARGRVQGALNIYRAGLKEFSDDEFRLAVRFGDAAALALDNARVRASLELQAQTDPLTGLWNHRAFHERLREELLRASTEHSSAALVMLDLDDFKRVNDVYGHALGDRVLAELADTLRATVRQRDAVCRVGGDEFAVIVPSAGLAVAHALAERAAEHVALAAFEPAGPLTLSIGIALGPEHAANPRELVACAEIAMMTAKARGKSRIVVFHEDESERPEAPTAKRESIRSIAHLKMLHGVSSKLSRLVGVAEIGSTVADELRQLIDYHNCRVFVREGEALIPVAFRGELSEAPGSTMEVLTTRVGVGVTGHVAETGEPFLTGDAAGCGIGHRIPGTAQIEESLLAVPLRYGPDVIGVIVISKLGLDQFDDDDVRLLEVLAGHASVALVNAKLYEAQRREAESAKALLELSRDLSSSAELKQVLELLARGAAQILDVPQASVWLPDTATGELVCRGVWNVGGDAGHAAAGDRLPPQVSAAFGSNAEPFVVTRADYEHLVGDRLRNSVAEAYAVAPLVLDQGWGALALALRDEPALFGERRLELLAGVAGQARLAVANALSFESLERTFLETVEALTNALEAKDEYTSSHTRWIRDMALKVGQELGLGQQTLKRVELAALFHDIGKIGIPAAILLKPGPLTDEERGVIETHPELGERILAPIEQLEDVRPIVRACHERYDGKGYPDRLGGEQIPLEARIIFACDAFHAMTADRPYREALTVEEARRRLSDAAGTQFDPEIVDVCLRVLEAPAP